MIRNFSTLAFIACYLGIAGQVNAELLVHYTFDDSDISGSTVLDVAGGDHNGLIINSVETGVSGPSALGQAIRLPNDDGLSYVSLMSSNNPTPTGSDARTIAFWFSQEAVGEENKMFGHGPNQSARSFDLSLEGGGIRLRYGGGNVTWGSGFDFAGADAGFHHLAIRVPNNANDFLDIDLLLDGVPLVGVPTGGSPGNTPISTAVGGQTNVHIGRTVGAAAKGDFIGLIDDFRIYDNQLTDEEIRALIPSLTLEVDLLTGFAAIRNLTDFVIDLDSYEVSSVQASINTLGWNSLQNQDRVNFPGGSGSGNGWEEVAAESDIVAEWRLQGFSSLRPGEWINLGAIFDPSLLQDLEFIYGLGADFTAAKVEFLAARSTADFDLNDAVDAADLSGWQSAFGIDGTADANGDGDSDGFDYLTWQRQFGDILSVSAAQRAVPEPTSAMQLLTLALAGVFRRSRNR